MVLNLAPSQRDLIQGMILENRLKTYEITPVAEMLLSI